MCATWIEGFNPDPILNDLEQGWTVDGFPGQLHDHFVSVASIVKLDALIPELEQHRLVTSAIFAAARAGILTRSGLLSTIDRLESDYLAQPNSRYVLLTSISVPFDEALKPRNILGTRIQFSHGVPRGFRRSKEVLILAHQAFPNDLPEGFAVVRVHVEAKGAHEAGVVAFSALDLLRGVWNISLNLNRWALFRNMDLEPINQIICGPISTLHNPKGEPAENHFWYHRDYPLHYFPRVLNVAKITEWEKELRRLRKQHLYGSEIDQALIRYCRALDYVDPHTAFIKLWGLLEFLTDSNDDVVIARRVASLYVDESIASQRVKYLRRYRHASVHRDIETEAIIELLFQLMHLVEHVFIFHLRNKRKFSSRKNAARSLGGKG